MKWSGDGSEAVGDEVRGSFHGDDVFYLLGLSLLRNGSPEDVELAEQLIAYVAGFSYAGSVPHCTLIQLNSNSLLFTINRDPNEHGGPYKDDKTNSGLIFWEPYSLAEQRYLSLGQLTDTQFLFHSN